MKYSRIIRTFFATAILIAGSAAAFAHNGIEHVLGTVKQLTATSLTVETVKHETTTIILDPATTFSAKGAKASVKDLTVGERVAVDTKDDASDKPHAISVRWGATSPAGKAATGKAAPKMDPNMKM
jgi:hypothetical protein